MRGDKAMKTIDTLMELVKKNLDKILYLVFGALTTLVNMGVYWLLAHPLGCNTMVSTVVAWFAAVLTAYLTNRKWVFHSQAATPGEIAREVVSFFGCRIATGVVDWLCMLVFVEWLGLNDVVIKFLANVLVILLNYVLSKLVIFRKRG